MTLSEEEKNGMQVYRNYSRAFDDDRAKRFTQSVGENPRAITDLSLVLKLIRSEEPRTLPVIACAFADDQLKEMFRREIPNGVPGGRSELLSGFGPLSRLSQRVQMAYAFSWLSKVILVELDHLRKIRNEVSHKWDITLLEGKMAKFIEHRQQKIEELIGDDERLPISFHESLLPIQKLRVRLIWLLGRVTYECHLWVPALKANLAPQTVLYGANAPAMLNQVSTLCLEITRSGFVSGKSKELK